MAVLKKEKIKPNYYENQNHGNTARVRKTMEQSGKSIKTGKISSMKAFCSDKAEATAASCKTRKNTTKDIQI